VRRPKPLDAALQLLTAALPSGLLLLSWFVGPGTAAALPPGGGQVRGSVVVEPSPSIGSFQGNSVGPSNGSPSNGSPSNGSPSNGSPSNRSPSDFSPTILADTGDQLDIQVVVGLSCLCVGLVLSTAVPGRTRR
jgi:hypothetical protein